MKKLLQAMLILGFAASPAAAAELTVITAGDQNMVDYINEYLGPLFEEQNPGNTVRVVGTGPGDAGSQKIVERFEAQKQAGTETWDTDVARRPREVYRPDDRGRLSGSLPEQDRDRQAGHARQCRHGARRQGLRLCHADVQQPDGNRLQSGARPEPAEELRGIGGLGEGQPEAVRLQRHQGRRLGRQLRHGLDLRFRRRRRQYADERSVRRSRDQEVGWRLREPEGIHPERDADQCGTLDLLSRGEIAMGPVWVDMFYSWQANGQLPPELKLVLPAPGMPGQPMHYVVPAKSPNKELAEKFVALATSPKVQAEGIVKRFNWYPGIDAQYVQPELDEATWNKLFIDVTPEDLANFGKPFPIAPYNNAILEAYERQATN